MERPTAVPGLGASVVRIEDQRFLTGQGRFVDDVPLPGARFACIVRSPHAHARIAAIDPGGARVCPGVLLVLTGPDLALDRVGALACAAYPNVAPGRPGRRPLQPILAGTKVRHVGEPVAIVVADSHAAARDAAEHLQVTYEPLPAAMLGDALAEGAPTVWDDVRDNLAFVLERGDREATDRAFSGAAHVTHLAIHYPRASANSIESRGVCAWLDPIDGRHVVCSSTQFPFQLREALAQCFGLAESSIRVIAPDVGGAFGMKSQIYPEEALVLWAAMRLRAPVKWIADRSESLAADMHGRHQRTQASLALDANGRALALRVDVAIDLGAYLGYSAGVAPNNAAISYTNTYDIGLIQATVRAVFTNTTVVGPYRGTAKPEATHVVERLFEQAARELGIDRIELRRRNLIRPEQMPYFTPGGYRFDSGQFERVLDRAIARSDWAGFRERRRASEARGLRRGQGLAMHCQRAGSQSERMEIRVAPDGSIMLHVGTLATGQGHETVFAQLVAGWFGVPMGSVRVCQGDTDKVLYGRGTFAQRSMNAGGSALRLAADQVIRKGKAIAAWMLEAAEDDIDFRAGRFLVRGTDRVVSFGQMVAKAYLPVGLPSALGVGLEGVGHHDGPNNFPNGCMTCEVEIDVETGAVSVDRLVAVDDVGVVVNPLLLAGQLHGSIAQGLGQALHEEIVYERDSGQLLSGSFLDYTMPRADDLPQHLVDDVVVVPTQTNLLGVKGGSEAGNVGAPPAIVNAILDALRPLGVTDISMPATPERVWRAIEAARTTPPPV